MSARRVAALSVSLMAIISLVVSCSSGGELDVDVPSSAFAPVEAEPPDEPTGVIEVDEGLLSVEVTIPKEFFEGMTAEEITEAGAETGYSSTTVNADGTVTYKMSRKAHQKLLQEMKGELDEGFLETYAEKPNVFRKITYNDDVTVFTVEVNRVAFESDFEAEFVGFGLGLWGIYYQMFAGVAEADLGLVIDFVDSSSGEVFNSQDWPGEE